MGESDSKEKAGKRKGLVFFLGGIFAALALVFLLTFNLRFSHEEKRFDQEERIVVISNYDKYCACLKNSAEPHYESGGAGSRVPMNIEQQVRKSCPDKIPDGEALDRNDLNTLLAAIKLVAERDAPISCAYPGLSIVWAPTRWWRDVPEAP